MSAIQFGKENIPYELTWSNKRKTLGISVHDDNVLVTAPFGTSKELINAVLYKKAPWIRKQLLDYTKINPYSEKKAFISGEKLHYLGRSYRLKVLKDDAIKTAVFKFYRGTFFATVPASLQESQYRDALYPLYKEWIITKANSFVQERYLRFCSKLGETPTQIQIKEQNKRWGSCTPEGKVLLNWRIFLAPTSIVDYVLAHELAHLKYMDHSPQFWNTIKILLPEYEDKKEWLRMNGKQLYT